MTGNAPLSKGVSMLDILSAAASAGGDAPPAWISWLPILGMIVIFWFLIIRPQMRQQKEHRAKVAGMKKGDMVVTAGGLIGKVLKVDENYVDLELGQGVRVKAVKNTIGDIIQPGGSAPAND
jgi:preprotein translocase subunit YajC